MVLDKWYWKWLEWDGAFERETSTESENAEISSSGKINHNVRSVLKCIDKSLEDKLQTWPTKYLVGHDSNIELWGFETSRQILPFLGKYPKELDLEIQIVLVR